MSAFDLVSKSNVGRELPRGDKETAVAGIGEPGAAFENDCNTN